MKGCESLHDRKDSRSWAGDSTLLCLLIAINSHVIPIIYAPWTAGL